MAKNKKVVKAYLKAASPYRIAVSRIELDDIIHSAIVRLYHLEINELSKRGLYLYRNLIRDFALSCMLKSSRFVKDKQYKQFNFQERLMEIVLIDGLYKYVSSESLLEDFSTLEDDLTEEIDKYFDFYPEDYEPTGFEYLQVSFDRTLYFVESLGDYRILNYHGEV